MSRPMLPFRCLLLVYRFTKDIEGFHNMFGAVIFSRSDKSSSIRFLDKHAFCPSAPQYAACYTTTPQQSTPRGQRSFRKHINFQRHLCNPILSAALNSSALWINHLVTQLVSRANPHRLHIDLRLPKKALAVQNAALAAKLQQTQDAAIAKQVSRTQAQALTKSGLWLIQRIWISR